MCCACILTVCVLAKSIFASAWKHTFERNQPDINYVKIRISMNTMSVLFNIIGWLIGKCFGPILNRHFKTMWLSLKFLNFLKSSKIQSLWGKMQKFNSLLVKYVCFTYLFVKKHGDKNALNKFDFKDYNFMFRHKLWKCYLPYN